MSSIISSYAVTLNLHRNVWQNYSCLPLFWVLDLISLENNIIAIYTHDQTQTHPNHKIFLGLKLKNEKRSKKITSTKHTPWKSVCISVFVCVFQSKTVYLVRKYAKCCLKCTLFASNFPIIQTFPQLFLFVYFIIWKSAKWIRLVVVFLLTFSF